MDNIRRICLPIVIAVLAMASTSMLRAQDIVTLPIGTIPPGKSITVVFKTKIDSALPQGDCAVINQGTIAGSNFTAVRTDDPDSAGSSNPTVTRMLFPGATITANPSNTTVCAGSAASFTAAATGTPTPTVQWQVSTDGGSTWNNLAGETSTTLSFTTVATQNGNQYRAVFMTDACAAPGITTPATLTINTATTITANPSNMTVCAGSSATFTATASANPTPTVQWQQSTNGGSSWVNIAGATSTTLSFATVAVQNGNQFRAIFSNACGAPIASNPATLNVNTATTITSNPSNTTVCAGSNASFSVAFTGVPNPTVQWQISTNGGTTFVNIAGATSPTLTFVTVAAQNNNQFRAVLSNACGAPVTSAAATLTVNSVTTISAHPSDMTVCAGSSATFTATANANPAPTVQWQQSTDGGSSWVNIAGATSTTLSFATVPVQNGNRFRAVFSNACGAPVASNPATLNVNTATVITANPQNTTVCAGSNASFSVAFTGVPNPGVQWQISTNGGTTFVNIAGATSPTLTFVTVAAQNNNQFRAVLSNACGAPVTSAAATLTVNTVTTVTQQPVDGTTCEGGTISFTSTASGNPAPTVQWQVSTNGGGTWAFINGAAAQTNTIAFTVSRAQNGHMFRAMYSNACGAPVFSNVATMNVHWATTITQNPVDANGCAGDPITFTAAADANPTASVQWQVSTDGGTTFNNIAGATSTTYSFTAQVTDNGRRYRAEFANACDAPVATSSATVTIGVTPTITQHPQDQTVCYGYPATFSVTADAGPTPLTYQWRVEGQPIPGATSTSYLIPNATLNDGNKRYDVIVSSCSTSDTSTMAQLTVLPPPSLSVSVSPGYIQSSDHSLKTINAAVTVTGGCSTQVSLHSITSSEADAGAVTGDVAGDIVTDSVGVSPAERTFQLRAEAGANGRTYRIVYRVVDGSMTMYDTSIVAALAPGVTIGTGPQSPNITLNEPNPNPMSTTTSIGYSFTSYCWSRLTIYTLGGGFVTDIVNNLGTTGTTVTWNGNYANGSPVPNGTYLMVLKGCGGVRTGVLTIQR